MHVISNPFCPRCAGRTCYRVLCPQCATYLAFHCSTAEGAERRAQHYLDDVHHCTPTSSPLSHL